MHATSYDAYNTLFNHLMQCANDYYAMAIDFDHSGLKGFYFMALNESHERWHMADYVRCYLGMNGAKAMITENPAPKQDYANPMEAINAARQMEMATVTAIDNSAKIAVENDPVELKKMGWLKHKCQYEKDEIDGLAKRMALSGTTLPSVDMMLLREYECKITDPCKRHKYHDNPCGRR